MDDHISSRQASINIFPLSQVSKRHWTAVNLRLWSLKSIRKTLILCLHLQTELHILKLISVVWSTSSSNGKKKPDNHSISEFKMWTCRTGWKSSGSSQKMPWSTPVQTEMAGESSSCTPIKHRGNNLLKNTCHENDCLKKKEERKGRREEGRNENLQST